MRRVALTLGLALTLTSTSAWGYEWMGAVWRLDFAGGEEVPWVLNENGCPDVSFDEAEQALIDAFQTWEDVDCSLVAFSYEGTTTSEDAGANDGVNVMMWEEDSGDWSYGMSTAGITLTWFGGGSMSDADIIYNAVWFVWTVSDTDWNTDIQAIATHENGHLFGLDHSDVPGSVMLPVGTGGPEMRNLTPDDIAGAVFLYPVEGCEMCTTANECPTGYDCVNGDCVQGSDNQPVCTPCSNDEQCGGDDDDCVPYPVGGSFCGAACTGDDDCQDKPGCEDRDCLCIEAAGGGANQCVPSDNSCEAPPECDDDNPCLGDYECVDGQCQPPACRELGGECETAENCCSSLCSGGVCTQTCDWLRPGDSCPSGFYCEIEECGVGVCKPGRLGGAGRGTACEMHGECSTGYCAATGGPTTCQTACDPDGLNTCPDDWSCTRIGASGCGLCSCQLGRLGDPCAERGDCASGLCARNEICTRRCNDASNPCPAGYGCLEAGDVSICWPDDGAFGAECAEDDDCTDGRCVNEACTRDCDTDCDCPDRHECVEVDGDRVCQRSTGGDDDGGGCGCATAGRDSSGQALAGALVVGLGFLAARRRRGD
jgi:MYXO-CTERM domain-containing protein